MIKQKYIFYFIATIEYAEKYSFRTYLCAYNTKQEGFLHIKIEQNATFAAIIKR